jgi:hypothetical protein
MDGSRFDLIARAMASDALKRPGGRRGFVGGLAALAAGLVGVRTTAAACGPDQINRRGLCVCKTTGRPPGPGWLCPCASGLTRCGNACVNTGRDGAHCGGCNLACAANEQCRSGACVCVLDCAGKTCGAPDGCGGTCVVQDCPPTQTCLAGGCGCAPDRGQLVNGSCGYPCGAGVDCAFCVGTCGPEFTSGSNYCSSMTSTVECLSGSAGCPIGSGCFGSFCGSLC